MTVSSQKITRLCDGRRLIMTLPCFHGKGSDKINAFYHTFADYAGQLAGRLGGTLVGELHIACEGDLCSIYIDLFGYCERKLVLCRRISDNRDADGCELSPPSPARHLIAPYGGWYTDGRDIYIYKNTFTPDCAGVRRSDVYRFIEVTRLERKSDSRS